MNSRRIALQVVLLFSLISISGCASIGPRTVAHDGFDYTGVLADSWKQRMLFNIVRVRYGDTPYFLDVASVINQYSLETGVTVGGQAAKVNQGDYFVAGGGHATYTDRPTITYMPLSGEKFARSLMRPLPPSAVMSMIESGYPIDLVLRVCVQSINGIRNRVAGTGNARLADPEFYPLLERMRRIQDSGDISLRVQKAKESELMVLNIRKNASPAIQEDSLFVRKTLGIDPAAEEIQVVYGSMAKDDQELAILTRSILQILVNLASQIDVPEAHVAEKVVNPSMIDTTPAGTAIPPLIKIQSSPSKPDNAFVMVHYQSNWFWIDNRDMRSKGLFTFLMFLFSLTETGGKEGAPIVTISAGG